MKILIVSHCFSPAVDGGSILLSRLGQSLASLGHSIRVITSDRASSDDFINPAARKYSIREEWINGASVFRSRIFSRGRRLFKALRLLSGNSFWQLAEKGPVFISPRVFSFSPKPDLIIAGPFPTMACWWGSLLSRFYRVPLAIIPCLHPDDNWHQAEILKKITCTAKMVFCLTPNEKRVLKGWGLKQNQLWQVKGMIPDFENQKRRSFFPKKPIILYLGAKSTHKRIDVLLDAMRSVWPVTDAKLIIAGPETLSSPVIDRQIKKLLPSLRKRIEWLGQVSEKTKNQLLKTCTVLVNPSVQESFGLVIVEAWSWKKPVIVSDIPAFNTLVKHRQQGLVFPAGNSSCLAQEIIWLIKHRSLAVKMGRNGYQRALSYQQSLAIPGYQKAILEK